MKKTNNPKTLKPFQDWCIDTISMILKSKKKYRGNLIDQGYIYTLKSIVDHFSSMYYYGLEEPPCRNHKKEHINLWWDHLNKHNRVQFFSPLLMSKEAAEILNSEQNNKKLGGRRGQLHLEHITPTSYVYGKLQTLRYPSRKAIAACFKHCKLVLLTKEQSVKYLDSKNALFTKQDVAKLQRVFQVDEASLKEANDLVGTSPKSEGFGLLRLVHLYKSGVRFCNSKGKRRGLKQCLTYLEQDNYDF